METESFMRTAAGTKADKIATALQNIAEHIVIVVFGFLPILFLPISFIPLDYGKTIIAIVGLALAVIFFSLAVLRSGTFKFPAPSALIALWLVAAIASLSAIFSGDSADAFLGDLFEVNTAAFLILLALVGSLSSLMDFTKMAIMRLYIFLTASAVLLGIYHVARIAFGPEFLSFGLFTGAVSSMVGSWNDLGLFFGLSVLLSIVALEQLPLTRWGRVVFSVGIALSLAMLAIINFSSIWWVLGLVSLVMLMYSLTKDRFSQQSLSVAPAGEGSSIQSILVSLAVFIVSLAFIVAGGPLGGMIADATGVSHLEVRPSLTATIDIARPVYGENAFFGIGPNKFIDAWRQYKDPTINQTIFWDTDFRGGNGYITTFIVTTGILGALAWLVFLGLFLYAGFRMLFKTVHADKFWYFIGSSSFIAATYLWGMSLVYLPGATVLLLAALFTTVMFAAYVEIVGARTLSVSVFHDRRATLLLIGVVMIMMVASASVMYFTGRHFTAVYSYANALNSVTPGTSLTQVEQAVANSYSLFPNDTYARQIAAYQLGKINSLLGITEPTPEQQQEFQNAVVNGINSAQRAVEIDSTDAANWSVLGSVYSVLVAAGETEVIERAEAALANARKYAPNNPAYVLQEAQLQIRAQNIERGRELVSQAIAMKPNYTEALNFLTELEIATGRTAEAIAATRAVIGLEPNNPARHYQLAVLLSTQPDIPGTIAALERAVALNPNYANARYLLALAYVETDRLDEAVAQLEVVRDLNPDNAVVSDLITQIESGELVTAPPPTADTVTEPDTVVDSEGEVTAEAIPDTSLISPVNNIPTTPTEEEGPAAEAEAPVDTTESPADAATDTENQ